MRTTCPTARTSAAWHHSSTPPTFGPSIPKQKSTSYYIDLRTPGRKYENFYKKLKEDENIFFIKGKVAEVGEEEGTGNITLVAEDTMSGDKVRQTVDLLVLATGNAAQFSC